MQRIAQRPREVQLGGTVLNVKNDRIRVVRFAQGQDGATAQLCDNRLAGVSALRSTWMLELRASVAPGPVSTARSKSALNFA